MKVFTTIATLALFVSFTNAVSIAGNYGMCLSYATPISGEPVVFETCKNRNPYQTNWVVTNVPNGNGAITICANGVNLCVTIRTDQKFGSNGVLDYASDPNAPLTSQQFKQNANNFKLTNLFTGTGLCATNQGNLQMLDCNSAKNNLLQPMYIYGPPAPNRAAFTVDSESESEDYGYYNTGYGAGSPSSSYYPTQSYSSVSPYALQTPYSPYYQESPYNYPSYTYSSAVSPYSNVPSYPYSSGSPYSNVGLSPYSRSSSQHSSYVSPYSYSKYSQTPYYNNHYNNYYPFY